LGLNLKTIDPKHIHIVSFDIPYPPSYGGAIDVFYKIKELHRQGIKVHLHCFEYGRQRAKELTEFCFEINYYPRKLKKRYLYNSLPYIVISRSSEELVVNLIKDQFPILFEGLHCCFHLNDTRLANRVKLVRMHNIEHDYYENLANVERSFFKRLYYRAEARKLKKFETILHKASRILAISKTDQAELSKRYNKVACMGPFQPNEKVQIANGKGSFVLYHGNLEVGENNEAALYLVNQVFNDLDIPLVIAGNKPSASLIKASNLYKNIQLRGNISTEEIYELIKSAQINVLPTFQATGIKLKLLAALYNGRHCIVNSPMVDQTGLESLCSIADSPNEMKKKIQELFNTEFNEEEAARREKILMSGFSNKKNIQELISLLDSNQ